MSARDRILSAIRAALKPELTREPKTSPKRLPPTVSITGQETGKVGKANTYMYRNWAAHSEWIRGAINIRRSQISSAEWDVVPFDPTKPYSKRLQAKLKAQLNRPNPRNDSFRSFIEPIIEDLIVLDAGVVEKERNLLGELIYLWPVDGATIRVSANWDGDPNEARYFWYPDRQERARFKNNDMVYMMANPMTYTPVGLSPLESLKLTIEAEMYGHEFNRRQVTGAAPDGVLDLGEEATTDQVRAFERYFMSEVAGRGAVGFIGGTKGAKWIPFRQSNRDMQFLEWQTYLVRKICVVLGVTPQDLGITFDVNRATSDTQLQISEDRGLRPLMSLIQDYITEEIIWDESNGGVNNNLAFRFTALNLKETAAKANINKLALAGTPWKTVNEARIEDGRSPIGDVNDENNPANKLVMTLPQGAATLDDIPSVRELVEMMHPPAAPKPPAAAGAN